jgi:outer membrane protein TolC
MRFLSQSLMRFVSSCRPEAVDTTQRTATSTQNASIEVEMPTALRQRRIRFGAALLTLCFGCMTPKTPGGGIVKSHDHSLAISPEPTLALPNPPLVSSNSKVKTQIVTAGVRDTDLVSLVQPASAEQVISQDDSSAIATESPIAESETEVTSRSSSASEAGDSKSFPIDLPTALRLGDSDSLQVAVAQEQMRQAYIDYQQSGVNWLPSLRSGMHYHKHEGPLLSSSGELRETSRGSVYAGAGASAIGGGSPAVPGIFMNFHLADAIFQPLALEQRWGAREKASMATRNDTQLSIALAYLELMRAVEDVAIATDIRDKVKEVSRLTDAYATTGQGLTADAERMRVELGMRELDIQRSLESESIASSRLAQLLRLNGCCRLSPLEPEVIALQLVNENCECQQHVSMALRNRPELAQFKYLVGEAVERLRREQYAPMIPSVLLGTSYGGFGGGQGSRIGDFNDRLDFDASVFWEVRNLGLGEENIQRSARSMVKQANLRQLAMMDQVAREVIDAHVQIQSRKKQVQIVKHLLGNANQSYEQHMTRIQHGQGLPIETLQSVQSLLLARREYLRTITDHNIAQFTLRHATGWPVDAQGLPDDDGRPLDAEEVR